MFLPNISVKAADTSKIDVGLADKRQNLETAQGFEDVLSKVKMDELLKSLSQTNLDAIKAGSSDVLSEVNNPTDKFLESLNLTKGELAQLLQSNSSLKMAGDSAIAENLLTQETSNKESAINDLLGLKSKDSPKIDGKFIKDNANELESVFSKSDGSKFISENKKIPLPFEAPNLKSNLGLSKGKNQLQKTKTTDGMTGAEEFFQMKNTLKAQNTVAKNINSFNKVKVNESMLNFDDVSNEISKLENDIMVGSSKSFSSDLNFSGNKSFKLNNLGIDTNLGATKVLDLSNLVSSDSTSLIDSITNHLAKMKMANTDTLSLTVKHNELGNFRLSANNVNPGVPDTVNLEIISQSKDAHTFFKMNEGSLISTLADKGINLSSVKILTSSESSGKSFDSNFMNSEKNFSQQNQGNFDQNRRQESERRAALWQEYQDRLGA